MISLDCETTGLDRQHGARPFFITTCNERGEIRYWEAPVNVFTREVNWRNDDLAEVFEVIDPTKNPDAADGIVLQNAKFDLAMLAELLPEMRYAWPWHLVHETLYSGHLIDSSDFHDLTTMALRFLSYDIKPLELNLKKAVEAARKYVNKKAFVEKHTQWRTAKVGDPMLPSAESNPWRCDMWLPKTVIRHKLLTLDFTELPLSTRAPLVGRVDDCDVRIDRSTKWGNPFVIGKDGDRIAVIKKYATYILSRHDLLEALPELYGKTLGCHCSPNLCHGDVLKLLCHEWFTALEDYSNADSASTLSLHKEHMRIMQERKLLPIYNERLKMLPVVYSMEQHGITLKLDRLEELESEYKTESDRLDSVCKTIANDHNFELTLPKSGVNNSLREFIFDVMKLESPVKTETGQQSLNKFAMEHFMATLDTTSKQYVFINCLQNKRSRDTALTFIESYRKYMRPVEAYGLEWFIMNSSLNPTGTSTLRWSSQGPNEQQISKKEGFNLRYMFGPLPGKEWWSIDYDNLELRIPAYEAGEQLMIDVFERPDDPPFFGSYHLLNASIVYPDLFWPLAEQKGEFKRRYNATWYKWIKNFGFAIGYGAIEKSGTADRAAHKPGAQRLVQDRLKEIAKLNSKQISLANKNGFVETIPDRDIDPHHGYPLTCPRSNYGRVLETLPMNYHVQGTACWIMMRAMFKVQEYLDSIGMGEIVMNIHDELVIEFPFKEEQGNRAHINNIRAIMASLGDCVGVKLTCGVDYHPNNWAQAV